MGIIPPPRGGHATVYMEGPLTGEPCPFLMTVGGFGGRALGDVWMLDVDRGEWSEVRQKGIGTTGY